MRKKYLLAWIVFIVLFSHSWAAAQTTQSLEDEANDAEDRARIAKAKKEELEAKFPAPDADALSGNSSVSGKLIESRIQAYKAMAMISDQIAVAVKGKGIKGLYVFKESDYAKVAGYNKLAQQLRVINGEYAKCFPKGVGPDFAAPPGVLASVFLSWLPLLKTETKTSGEEFDIEEEAVWASLAQSLASKSVHLSSPFVSNFDFIGVNELASSGLLRSMETAEGRLKIPQCTNQNYGSKLLVDKSFQKLKESVGLVTSSPTPETNKTTTETTTAPPKVTVIQTVEKKPADTPPAAAASIWDHLQTEAMIQYMQTHNIFWIKLKDTKSGGNVRIKSNPLVDIFRGGNTVKFSGGSIAYYYVLDNDGNIVLSDVLHGYVPYTKSSHIR